MFCVRCGAQVRDGNRFCTHCGHSVANEAEARVVKKSLFNSPAMKVALAILVCVAFIGAIVAYRNAANERNKLADKALCIFQSGEILFEPEKICEVFKLALPAAKWGNHEAQYLVGEYYLFVRTRLFQTPRPRNLSRDAEMLTDAEGNVWGYGYQWAEGAKLYDEAAKWHFKAAKAGHEGSQWRMSLFCKGGLGVPRDNEASAKWEDKAKAHEKENKKGE